MSNLIWIAIGGGLGAVVRALVSAGIHSLVPGFRPLGTMVVNVVGCLLVGMVMGWVLREKAVGTPLHMFLVTGILGGFTTFSAFGYETVSLMEARQFFNAAINVAGNLLLGLPAVFLGARLMEWWS